MPKKIATYALCFGKGIVAKHCANELHIPRRKQASSVNILAVEWYFCQMLHSHTQRDMPPPR